MRGSDTSACRFAPPDLLVAGAEAGGIAQLVATIGADVLVLPPARTRAGCYPRPAPARRPHASL